MTNYIKLTTFILFSILVSCGGSDETVEEEGVEMEELVTDTIPKLPITIVEDCRDNPCDEIDVSAMLVGDVIVRRDSGEYGEAYLFNYFHDYSGELSSHGGLFISEDDYDQATYEWIDDTTIIFTLQNTETNAEYQMHLFGNGNSNGMIVPDDEEEL
jgi:hypothetical protein